LLECLSERKQKWNVKNQQILRTATAHIHAQNTGSAVIVWIITARWKSFRHATLMRNLKKLMTARLVIFW